MAKKAPAKKAPAKRKPRPKKPSADAVQPQKSALNWKPWAKRIAASIGLLVLGAAGGVWSAGGIEVGPGPVVWNDSLSESHEADRVSQVRILREYTCKTFSSEPEAQDWLNAQRIEARKTDWIPYTDELGAAADQGVEAVKALADKLEGKR
jgi:hypothetical protein